MGGLREQSGDGMGTGTGAPFRDKPPPRLSRKGALRAGSSINAPLRDNRGACLERVCSVVFCISRFYEIVLIFFFIFYEIVLAFFHLAGSSFLFRDGVAEIIERNLKRKEREIIYETFLFVQNK